MKTKIRRLGNSAGVILPAAMMRYLKLGTVQNITLTEHDGNIIISPAFKQSDKDTINALNVAINYALDVAKDRAEQFLKLWREAKVDEIAKEFLDFNIYLKKGSLDV